MNNKRNQVLCLKQLGVVSVSLLVLLAPLPLIADTTSSGSTCAQVITYGKDPATGKWKEFPTPCDIPKGWEPSPTNPDETTSRPGQTGTTSSGSSSSGSTCAQVITYGKDPATGKWKEFPTPCDIPKGWEPSPTNPDETTSQPGQTGTTSSGSSSGSTCAQVITYGKDPATGKWKEFPTPCDIPKGWEPSPTNPDETTSPSGQTSSPPSSGSSEGSNSGSTVPASDKNSCSNEIVYAQKPNTTPSASSGTATPSASSGTGRWYIFSSPCDVPSGWKKHSPTEKICAEVIIYAKNPKTKNWYPFATPCDVPNNQWETSLLKQESQGGADGGCLDTVMYAKSPATNNWYAFATPCEVPEGWKLSAEKPVPPEKLKLTSEDIACPQVITYAQHPDTKKWYAFATSCDVPENWKISATLPSSEDLCSNFYATYSVQEEKLHIPFVSYQSPDKSTLIFKEVELKALPPFNPLLLYLTKTPEVKK